MGSIKRYVCLFLALIAVNDAAQQTDLWLAAFEQVWVTVRDKHFDKTLGGVDWEKLGESTRASILAAKSENEARKAIGNMLEKLGQSHIGLIPRKAYPQRSQLNTTAHLGLSLRIIEGQAVVWRVAEGSPAALAGVKPGWILEVPRALSGNRLRDTIYVNSLSEGQEGKETELSFQPGGKLRLQFAKAKEKMISFGNLPPIPVEMRFERKRNVGYFHLSAWFDPDSLQLEMNKAIEVCRDCTGFVIDLRGNPGGMGILSATLLGWFVPEPVSMGTLYYRDYSLKLLSNPRQRIFRGKLAVLVDGLSMSTSEFFAGGVKDLGRGKIFGEATPGMALPSTVEILPTGDAFQYTTANYISAGAKALEGRGVSPDEVTPLTQADLLAGRDAALAAALQWIQNQEK